MIRMVCLTNSWQSGGRCVAGIDLETGDWVRPITRHGGAFPEETLKFGEHEVAPLDILEMDLEPPALTTRYQRENRVLNSRVWKLVGQFAARDLLPYSSRFPTVLHSQGRVVEPATLEPLLPEKWRSLELRGGGARSFFARQEAESVGRRLREFAVRSQRTCGAAADRILVCHRGAWRAVRDSGFRRPPDPQPLPTDCGAPAQPA